MGLVIIAAGGGCDAVACRAGTIYLTLEYHGAAVAADLVAIDITVGDQHQRYQRPRRPGQARDSLEVDFRQYPADGRVHIEATATSAGVPSGSGQTESALRAGCTALEMSLFGDGNDDMGNGANEGDLAGGPGIARDLAAPGAGTDLAPLPDLARTTPPVVTFSGLTPTAQYPSGTSSPAYTDTCPAGEAIAGFNYLVLKDSNGLQTGIIRVDLMCVHPDVSADGKGGWTVTWGRGDAVPGHGVSGNVNVQQMCPMSWFLTGFHGRSGASLDALLYTCAPILFDADAHAYMGPNLDIGSGVGGNGGSPFGPVYCPAGQVANVVRSRAQPAMPPDAFGLGCAMVSSH